MTPNFTENANLSRIQLTATSHFKHLEKEEHIEITWKAQNAFFFV